MFNIQNDINEVSNVIVSVINKIALVRENRTNLVFTRITILIDRLNGKMICCIL